MGTILRGKYLYTEFSDDNSGMLKDERFRAL